MHETNTPVAILLEESIPQKCHGCDTALEICAVAARKVLTGKLDFKTAADEVCLAINACGGRTVRPSGWAQTTPICPINNEN